MPNDIAKKIKAKHPQVTDQEISNTYDVLFWVFVGIGATCLGVLLVFFGIWAFLLSFAATFFFGLSLAVAYQDDEA